MVSNSRVRYRCPNRNGGVIRIKSRDCAASDARRSVCARHAARRQPHGGSAAHFGLQGVVRAEPEQLHRRVQQDLCQVGAQAVCPIWAVRWQPPTTSFLLSIVNVMPFCSGRGDCEQCFEPRPTECILHPRPGCRGSIRSPRPLSADVWKLRKVESRRVLPATSILRWCMCFTCG